MKEVQPPIKNADMLVAYQRGLLHFEGVMRRYELYLANPANEENGWLEYTRRKLFRVYRIRQGFLDAIAEYLGKQQQSA